MLPSNAPQPNDAWDFGANNNDESAAAVWRERERRQRTIRLFMMFLVMLLLMDGEESVQRKSALQLRRQKELTQMQRLERDVFQSRQAQEQRIRSIVNDHVRYKELVEKNGKDIESSVNQWAEQRAEQEKDQFPESAKLSSRFNPGSESDPDDSRKVFHYPWNTTGFYRGEWKRVDDTDLRKYQTHIAHEQGEGSQEENVIMDAISLEEPMERIALMHKDQLGVFLLPSNMDVKMRNDNNLTDMRWEELKTNAQNVLIHSSSSDVIKAPIDFPPAVPLTQESGRVVFQFFSRSVPSMKEISLVDGFIKIYDSNSIGYSTRKDILLRVRGVLIHSIGRLSLVSTASVSKSVFYVPANHDNSAKRRLEESLAIVNESNIDAIREDALSLFSASMEKQRIDWSLASDNNLHRKLYSEDTLDVVEESFESSQNAATESNLEADYHKAAITNDTAIPETSHQEAEISSSQISNQDRQLDISTTNAWSEIVFPYPFVRDDAKETVRRVKTPASREMPAREKELEENAMGCGFEISLDVGMVEWTTGAWRQLVSRKLKDLKRLDPSLRTETDESNDLDQAPMHLRGSWAKPIQDQALVMTLYGSIHSPDCNFTASLNATAIRTDWEATTSKAINYSFVMMLICLTQMLVLLRQVLHSQGPSAAGRVSLLSVGWQTLLDSLLCIMHIYLSLSIQPLFSAFASVAFFKLLIFCVIEMKYMAIIIQARNSSNGGQPVDVLRRQIALLHVRFYSSMAAAFVLLFYVGDKLRPFYVLALYSFWVPQIIWNIITEAKTPLHNSYIWGMSTTRLFAPIYILSFRNNFLREVYPEAPYDIFSCQIMVLWVGFQTAILLGQRKYGARFMIPTRCLPPKFDYSRPIPASMLPPGALDAPISLTEAMEDRDSDPLFSSTEQRPSERMNECESSQRVRHTTATTTRNRIRGSRGTSRTENVMVTEQLSPGMNGPRGGSSTTIVSTPFTHSLECSICYDGIDIRKRSDYMLAPCNHLFHRECLVQWMDVKMECPICRTALPTL